MTEPEHDHVGRWRAVCLLAVAEGLSPEQVMTLIYGCRRDSEANHNALLYVRRHLSATPVSLPIGTVIGVADVYGMVVTVTLDGVVRPHVLEAMTGSGGYVIEWLHQDGKPVLNAARDGRVKAIRFGEVKVSALAPPIYIPIDGHEVIDTSGRNFLDMTKAPV